MNTTPAEEILALWVEDELHGQARAEVDAWAATQPEWLGYREDARRLKPLVRSAIPAQEEPPYADFFNARIAREISLMAEPVAAPRAASRHWLTWLMPTAAAAGMALCFWAGTHVSPSTTVAANDERTASLGQVEERPVLYTPQSGVKAAWYASTESSGAVIVLDGIAAIPDSFEIPETASNEVNPEDATMTAGLER